MNEEDIYKLDILINDLALKMYRKARICWEEINVKNAETYILIKARDIIQKELDERLN